MSIRSFIRDKFAKKTQVLSKEVQSISGAYAERANEMHVAPEKVSQIHQSDKNLKGYKSGQPYDALKAINDKQKELAENLKEREEACLKASHAWSQVNEYGQEMTESFEIDVYKQKIRDAELASKDVDTDGKNKTTLVQFNQAADAFKIVHQMTSLQYSKRPWRQKKQIKQMDSICKQVEKAMHKTDLADTKEILAHADSEVFKLQQECKRSRKFLGGLFYRSKEIHKPLALYQQPAIELDKSIKVDKVTGKLNDVVHYMSNEHAADLKLQEQEAIQAKAEAKEAQAQAIKKQKEVERINTPGKVSVFKRSFIDHLRGQMRENIVLDNSELEESNVGRKVGNFIGAFVGASDLAGGIGGLVDKAIDAKHKMDKKAAQRVVTYFSNLPENALDEHIRPAVEELSHMYQGAIMQSQEDKIRNLTSEMVGRYIGSIASGTINLAMDPKDQIVLSTRTGTRWEAPGKKAVGKNEDGNKLTVQATLDRAPVKLGDQEFYYRKSDLDSSMHARTDGKYAAIKPPKLIAQLCDMHTPDAKRTQFVYSFANQMIRQFGVTPSFIKESEHNEQVDNAVGLKEDPLLRKVFDTHEMSGKVYVPAEDRIAQFKDIAGQIFDRNPSVITSFGHSVNPSKDGINKVAKQMVSNIKVHAATKEFDKWRDNERAVRGGQELPVIERVLRCRNADFRQKAVAAAKNKGLKGVVKAMVGHVSAKKETSGLNVIKESEPIVAPAARHEYADKFVHAMTEQLKGKDDIIQMSDHEISRAANELAHRYATRIARMKESSRNDFVAVGVERAINWIKQEGKTADARDKSNQEKFVIGVEQGNSTKKPIKLELVGEKKMSRVKVFKSGADDGKWTTEKNVYTNQKPGKYGTIDEIDTDRLNAPKEGVDHTAAGTVAVAAGAAEALDVAAIVPELVLQAGAIATDAAMVTDAVLSGGAVSIAAFAGVQGAKYLANKFIGHSESGSKEAAMQASQEDEHHYWRNKCSSQQEKGSFVERVQGQSAEAGAGR